MYAIRSYYVMLLAAFLYVGILGIIWDGSLIYLGIAAGVLLRGHPQHNSLSRLIDFTRQRRFFACGFWPQLLLLVTAFTVYGTGNITLIRITSYNVCYTKLLRLTSLINFVMPLAQISTVCGFQSILYWRFNELH